MQLYMHKLFQNEGKSSEATRGRTLFQKRIEAPTQSGRSVPLSKRVKRSFCTAWLTRCAGIIKLSPSVRKEVQTLTVRCHSHSTFWRCFGTAGWWHVKTNSFIHVTKTARWWDKLSSRKTLLRVPLTSIQRHSSFRSTTQQRSCLFGTVLRPIALAGCAGWRVCTLSQEVCLTRTTESDKSTPAQRLPAKSIPNNRKAHRRRTSRYLLIWKYCNKQFAFAG